MIANFREEVLKSIQKGKDKQQLEYFKRELIKILEQNENKREEIISKSIEEYDKSIAKTFRQEFGVEKAGYGIGTVRVWKGEKYRKIAPGKWRKIYDSNTRGARQSVAIIKKKIQNAESIDELLQIVMENTNRFMDADGKLLPIVEELKNAVNESKGKLNAGKPSTKEQIDKFKKENGKSEENKFEDEIKELDAEFKKVSSLDIYRNDYEHMKPIHDKAVELYGKITKNLRSAENENDWDKAAAYERLKGDIHTLLANVQWRFEEVEHNYIKQQVFEGIEKEKDFKRTDISESEDNAIVDFNNKISEFIKEHNESTWSVNSDLYTLLRNTTDKKAAQRWCILNDIFNYDSLKKELLLRIKREKNRAANEAREEKINKINQENALKTYTDEEINKALEGVNSLIAERNQLKEQIKEAIDKENDARKRYDIALRDRDETRHTIWDEVLAYRKEVNKLAEERDNFEKKLDEYLDPIAYYYLRDYKYGKDESINDCTTTEEVEKLIKSKDWYSDEGKNSINLKRMDVKAAKEVFKCMERLFAIFPEQKGRNGSMNCEPVRKNWWAFASLGVITFNSKHYSDYEAFEKEYEKTEGNFHPKGTTAKDITYHEYYHIMTSGRGSSLAKRIKANVTKRLRMRGKKGGPKQNDIIKFGVSEYATTNADEFGAECFCQALGSENPTAFAIEVFKETLKYKKYMRGMV